jgi:putative ABC transport system substrate-binding protein
MQGADAADQASSIAWRVRDMVSVLPMVSFGHVDRPMRRREFLAGFAGAAICPLLARAQQDRPVIGFLHAAARVEFPQQLAAFHRGLNEGGYIEGQNLTIEYRWADNQSERLPELAADLVRQQVAVVVAIGGTQSILAAKNATTTIPVVFNTGADPVKMGLVASLNRPGGNVTGSSFFAEELGSKALGLLHEIVPGAKTVGLMINPRNPETPRQSAETAAAARALGVTIEIVRAGTPPEIDQAFHTLTERRAGALLIGPDAFYGTRIQQFVGLAARHRLPLMSYRREYVEAGGLVSYGTDINEAWRQTAMQVTRVLKGAKPAELPVFQATKFEFVINLKTARSLGIDVPGAISARADDIIE